jgi:hypothetical protein
MDPKNPILSFTDYIANHQGEPPCHATSRALSLLLYPRPLVEDTHQHQILCSHCSRIVYPDCNIDYPGYPTSPLRILLRLLVAEKSIIRIHQ